MAQGPLIPGLREFDRPRRGWPRWLTVVVLMLLAAVTLIVVAGFVGGVGPLRVLGQSTVPLEAVAYRSTSDPQVIEVGVSIPREGLCREDDVNVVTYERGNRIEVDGSATRSRSAACQPLTLGGELQWVPVTLRSELGSRTVIAVEGRAALEDRSEG